MIGPYDAKFSKKTTGSGAAWHPGNKGHLLRAHSIAYPLLEMLDHAVDQVLTAKTDGEHVEKRLLLKTRNEIAVRHPPRE